MELLMSFWIPGFMPVQFLLLFAAAFLAFVVGQYVLKQCGWRVTAFWQAILIWVVTYWILKETVYPALPSSLLYTYMGVTAVAIFCFISATEEGWAECRNTVASLFGGETRRHRLLRVLVFTVTPIIASWVAYSAVAPPTEEPIELRTSHPAPPRTITVHGMQIDLQTAKNPFRIDEGLQPPLSR